MERMIAIAILSTSSGVFTGLMCCVVAFVFWEYRLPDFYAAGISVMAMWLVMNFLRKLN